MTVTKRAVRHRSRFPVGKRGTAITFSFYCAAICFRCILCDELLGRKALGPRRFEKGCRLASMDSAVIRNRSAHVFIAGCCFIAVMCAVQAWHSNQFRLGDCEDTGFDDAVATVVQVDAVWPCDDTKTTPPNIQPSDLVFSTKPPEKTPFVPTNLTASEPPVPPPPYATTVRRKDWPPQGVLTQGALTQDSLPQDADAEPSDMTGPDLFSSDDATANQTDQPVTTAQSSRGVEFFSSEIEMAAAAGHDAEIAASRSVEVHFDTSHRDLPDPSASATNVPTNGRLTDEPPREAPTFDVRDVEAFARQEIQAPVETMQLSPTDFEWSHTDQLAELQQLEASAPVAQRASQDDLTVEHLAATDRARLQPHNVDYVPEPTQLPQRDEELLDDMIEDFERKILESEGSPSSRPIYRPSIDGHADPLPEPEPPLDPEPVPEPERPANTKRPATQRRSKPRSSSSENTAWPKPVGVFKTLDRLMPVYGVKAWSAAVRHRLDQMSELPTLSDPSVVPIIAALQRLAAEAGTLSRHLERSQQIVLRQAAYALTRRSDVWLASHRAAQPAHARLPSEVYDSVNPQQMRQRVAAARHGLSQFDNGNSWVQYLLLDELEQAAVGRGPFTGAARTELAEIVLDRLTDPTLSQTELAFLKSLGTEELGQELRLWATHPVSLTNLLTSLERFELEPTNPIKASRLADYRKDLHWSAVPSQNSVALALDKHYRNANIRLSVNEAMINRLVPAVREMQRPVRENVLGAQVKGHSRTRAKMVVRLLPDHSRLRFMFETRGELAANTSATKGPVTLLNRNNSHFQVRKIVVLDETGAKVGRSQAVASGKMNLQGMRTRYDNVPIIGSMVRRAAKRQQHQNAGLVRNIFVNRVEEQARQQVDRQVETELALARKQFDSKVYAPLRRLDLNPRAMEMKTLQNGRIILRSRLAADHQLAGFTARPQAFPDNFLSMQIHESAINNFFQQLNLDGRKATLQELHDDLAKQMTMKTPAEPVEIPEDVVIQFAEKAAIRVVVKEGGICLKLRIKSLKPKGEKGWKNFEVSADYLPYRDEGGGMEFYFSRGKGICLSKRNIALRAIFTKVLSPDRKIHLINPELAQDERFADLNVTQMELHDGWIGISVGPGAASPNVAVHHGHYTETR